MRAPGVVIAAASIMFVYGALLLICVGCSGLGLAMKDPHDQLGIEARLDKEAPGHTAVGIAGAAFNLLFAVALFACGVGILFLSNIARYVTYLVCMAIPIVTLASSVYQTVVVFPVTERIMAEQFQGLQKGQQGAPPIDFGLIMKGGAALGLIIALGVPLIFCGPIIVLISLKSARRAFAGDFDEPRPPWEDDRDTRRTNDDDAPRKPSSGPSQGDTGIQEHS